MSQNYYSEIYLHFVWHTKGSAPLLSDEVELLAHRELKKRLVQTRGAFVFEIGGTPTHVHLCTTIPPTLCISTLIGELKGGVAHEVNRRLGAKQKVLQWQTGYGVVSFGRKDLPWVRSYVRNQPQHHAQQRVYDRLERITEVEKEPIPEIHEG